MRTPLTCGRATAVRLPCMHLTTTRLTSRPVVAIQRARPTDWPQHHSSQCNPTWQPWHGAILYSMCSAKTGTNVCGGSGRLPGRAASACQQGARPLNHCGSSQHATQPPPYEHSVVRLSTWQLMHEGLYSRFLSQPPFPFAMFFCTTLCAKARARAKLAKLAPTHTSTHSSTLLVPGLGPTHVSALLKPALHAFVQVGQGAAWRALEQGHNCLLELIK